MLGFDRLPELHPHVPQVLEDRGIFPGSCCSSCEKVLRLLDSAQAVVNPSQAVLEGRVVRLERDGFLDHPQRLLQLDAAVRQHVSEVIQSLGVVWVPFQESPKGLLRSLEPAGALLQRCQLKGELFRIGMLPPGFPRPDGPLFIRFCPGAGL